jgi:hypothetical protein
MDVEERGRKEGEDKGDGDEEDDEEVEVEVEVELRAVRLEGERSEEVSSGLYFTLYGDSAHIFRLCTSDSSSSTMIEIQ